MPTKKYGPWELDTEDLILAHGEDYWIDLQRISTSAEMLDWICQLAQKSWVTPTALGYLVLAFEDIFDPQANLCGSGKSKTINATQYLRRRYPKPSS
jgi:hypothetical protein